MKKENRNCNMPYPVYPPYQGMMPGMMNNNVNYPMPIPYNVGMNQNYNMTPSDQLSNIEQQIKNLDRRVTALENSNSSSSTYSSSNYQMM